MSYLLTQHICFGAEEFGGSLSSENPVFYGYRSGLRSEVAGQSSRIFSIEIPSIPNGIHTPLGIITLGQGNAVNYALYINKNPNGVETFSCEGVDLQPDAISPSVKRFDLPLGTIIHMRRLAQALPAGEAQVVLPEPQISRAEHAIIEAQLSLDSRVLHLSLQNATEHNYLAFEPLISRNEAIEKLINILIRSIKLGGIVLPLEVLEALNQKGFTHNQRIELKDANESLQIYGHMILGFNDGDVIYTQIQNGVQSFASTKYQEPEWHISNDPTDLNHTSVILTNVFTGEKKKAQASSVYIEETQIYASSITELIPVVPDINQLELVSELRAQFKKGSLT